MGSWGLVNKLVERFDDGGLRRVKEFFLNGRRTRPYGRVSGVFLVGRKSCDWFHLVL